METVAAASPFHRYVHAPRSFAKNRAYAARRAARVCAFTTSPRNGRRLENNGGACSGRCSAGKVKMQVYAKGKKGKERQVGRAKGSRQQAGVGEPSVW